MAVQSAADIAIMIGHPIEVVRGIILALTDGGPSGFEKKVVKRHNKKLTKAAKEENKRKRDTVPRRTPRQVKVVEKVFKTRRVDEQEMVSIRMDARTVIFVKRGSDIEAIKQKYRERDPAFLKPENPNTVVKKFKPLTK